MKSLNFRLNRPGCSRSGIIARRHRVTKQGAISNPHKWISNIFVAPFSAIAFPLSFLIFAYNNISLRALASLFFQLLKTGWLIGWTFLNVIWKQFKFIWFHLSLHLSLSLHFPLKFKLKIGAYFSSETDGFLKTIIFFFCFLSTFIFYALPIK